MHPFISDFIYFCEPYDRYHAYLDLQRLSSINGGIVRTPERVLASRWMWSIGKVRRYIAELVEHGALEQLKSGRNNVIRIPLETGDPSQSHRARADKFRNDVVAYSSNIDIEVAALNQYIDYWLKFNPVNNSFRFESFEGFDIGQTLEYWINKRKSINNNTNTNHNGNFREHAAPCSTKGDNSPALTIEDIK